MVSTSQKEKHGEENLSKQQLRHEASRIERENGRQLSKIKIITGLSAPPDFSKLKTEKTGDESSSSSSTTITTTSKEAQGTVASVRETSAVVKKENEVGEEQRGDAEVSDTTGGNSSEKENEEVNGCSEVEVVAVKSDGKDDR